MRNRIGVERVVFVGVPPSGGTSNAIFHVYSNAGKPSRARMQRARGADRPDRSERIQLYERIKCPASDYSGDTAKALHCQRDNSKTGGVPINQPTGLKYRCRNRMDRLLGTCAVEGGCFL